MWGSLPDGILETDRRLAPNQTVEAHLTYEDPGPWAFHCHLLFHMMTGMFARFEVAPELSAEESASIEENG